MAALTDLLARVRNLFDLHQQRHATTLDLLRLCLTEIRNSRPFDYAGSFHANQARDDRRRKLIAALEGVLAQEAAHLHDLRTPRSPDPRTGD